LWLADVEAGTMTLNTAAEALPTDGLSLQDFAQRVCCSAWGAWDKAEKEVAALGGRPPLVRRSYRSSYMDDGPSVPPQCEVTIQHSRALKRADEAWRALLDAVLPKIKGDKHTIRGVPKGEYRPIEIWPALLDTARIVDLQGSTIVTEAGRRFEHVRVFQAVAPKPQAVLVAAPLVQLPGIQPSVPASSSPLGRKRGPKGELRTHIKNKMIEDVEHCRLTLAALETLKEEAMANTYSASRDTCRKARGDAVAELSARNSDK
jgi:hypothetical protein